MKRQWGDVLGNDESERKGKKAAAAAEEEEVVVGHGGDGGLMTEEEEILVGWCWRWGEVVAVDEQMSWGTWWDPCWDVGIMGGEAYNELYNDVLWEDDVWELKQIKDVPMAPGRSSLESTVHN